MKRILIFLVGLFAFITSASAQLTYATWNPSDKGANITLSGGNLTANHTAYSAGMVRATIGKNGGKWYWETTLTYSGSPVSCYIGVANGSASTGVFLGSDANGWSYYPEIGNKVNNNTYNYFAEGVQYGGVPASGAVIGWALDMVAGTLTMYINGVNEGVIFTGLTGTIYPAFGNSNSFDAGVTANFGATPFAYSVPSGYNPGFYNSTGNQAPIANAGPDQNVYLPTSTATLDATASFDNDGTIAGYQWYKASGPAGDAITSYTSATTTVTGLVQGVYKYFVIVTDNLGLTGADTVQITVNPAGSNIKYVRKTGNDATGDGSLANPWLTVYKATSTVNTVGATIDIGPGTYLETNVLALAPGVSMVGAGQYNGGTILQCTNTSDWTALLNLTSGEGVDGNQSISYIQFDGQSLASFWGILITGRKNVEIHHIWMHDFKDRGVNFIGRGDLNTGAPGVYAVGNKIHDSKINNCAAYNTANGVYGRGGLCIGGQNGILVYNDSLIQKERPNGYNGWPIKYASDGYNRNMKIYNNYIEKIPYGGTYTGENGWDFAIEFWATESGCEIHHNTIVGGAIDIDNAQDNLNTGYGIWIHDNVIYNVVSNDNYEDGIILETWQLRSIVENNIIYNKTSGVQLTCRYGTTMNDVRIRKNLMYNLGRITNTNDGKAVVVGFDANAGNVVKNLYVDNNTCIAEPTKRPYFGFKIVGDGAYTLDSIYVRNNIFQNFWSNGIVNDANGATAHGWVQNNNTYLSTAIGNPFAISQVISGNVSVDPLYVAGNSYALQGSSPMINAGIDVGLAYSSTAPDIGYYEYSTGNISPTANAGTDITITLPTTTTTLTGSGTDPDGSIASYAWTKISGPTGGTITSPSSASTGITALSTAGTYVFRLTVTDNLGATGTDDINVIVNPGTPTYKIPVQRKNTWNGNGLSARDVYRLFDGDTTTPIKGTNNIDDSYGSVPYRSFIVLDSVYTLTQVRHFVANNTGDTLVLKFYDANRTPIGSNITLITSGQYLNWVTNPISYQTGVRTIEVYATNINAVRENIMEVELTGYSTSVASSIMPIATPVAAVDLNRYAHGVSTSGDRYTRITSNGDTIMKRVSGSARIYWTGQEFDSYPSSYTGRLKNADFWLGRFGDPAITMQYLKRWNIKLMPAKSGGSIKWLDATTANQNTTWLGGTIAQSYKYMETTANPDIDTAHFPIARQYKNIAGLWGNNPSAPIQNNITGGSATKGQNLLGALEWDNEPNRFWVTTYYYQPLQYYRAMKAVYDSAKVGDPGLPLYAGALPGIDTMYWKALAFWHYWSTGSMDNFPCDGFNFNNYMNDARTTQQTGSYGITPERYNIRGILSSTQSFFQRHFPTKKVRWTEFGYGADAGSIYKASAIGGKSIRQVQADWTLRTKAISQSLPFVEAMYYYAFFEDGSAPFNTMGLVHDNFGGGGAYTFSDIFPVTYALGQELYVENGFNWFSTVRLNGDSSSVWVTKKFKVGDTTKQLYKVWRGTDDGSNNTSYVVSVPNAQTAKLYTQRYDSYLPDSANLTITSGNVTVPTVSEGMSWILVSTTVPANIPPIANAGVDKTITSPTSSVALSGSGYDPDGLLVDTTWTQLSGPNTATFSNIHSFTPTVSNLIVGTYQFKLSVRDNSSVTSVDTMLVYVLPTANIPPVVTTSASVGTTRNSINLTGSATDVDGTIASYQWVQTSGPTILTFTPANAASTVVGNISSIGLYTVELRATDNGGAIGVKEVRIMKLYNKIVIDKVIIYIKK